MREKAFSFQKFKFWQTKSVKSRANLILFVSFSLYSLLMLSSDVHYNINALKTFEQKRMSEINFRYEHFLEFKKSEYHNIVKNNMVFTKLTKALQEENIHSLNALTLPMLSLIKRHDENFKSIAFYNARLERVVNINKEGLLDLDHEFLVLQDKQKPYYSYAKQNAFLELVYPLWQKNTFIGALKFNLHIKTVYDFFVTTQTQNQLLFSKESNKDALPFYNFYITHYVKDVYFNYLKTKPKELESVLKLNKGYYKLYRLSFLDIENHETGGLLFFIDIKEAYTHIFDSIVEKALFMCLIYISLFMVTTFSFNHLLKELSKNQDKLKTILDTTPSLTILCKNGRIVALNKSFERFFDFINTKALLNGKDSLNNYLRYKESSMQTQESSCALNQRCFDFIVQNPTSTAHVLVHKNAKDYFFLATSNYTDDSHEEIVVTLSNVTLLEQMKKEQVDNAKFSAIGKLSAGITHEINTPLTYIKGNLELLQYDIEDIQDEKLKRNMKETFNTLIEGTNRIHGIVESMKEIFKKDVQKKEIANTYNTIITSLILGFNRAKHITPIYINQTRFSPDLDKDAFTYTSYIQKQRVEQVWIVLVNNALDEFLKSELAFDERFIKIGIATLPDKIRITFEDNAGGIDKKILEHLFEPFKSTKNSSGIGVGLSIAKKIILEQNGSIRAYNKGTNQAVFEVILPRYQETNT